MTRLAVRDGKTVRDSVQLYKNSAKKGNKTAYKPDMAGWGFIVPGTPESEKIQNNPALLDDPMMDLFGSMYKRGRIHISDAFAKHYEDDAQYRMHVAVDRFSGGANEGALFDNQVLTGDRLRFPVTVIIEDAGNDEKRWIEKTLTALHLGIIRAGSSKAGGRLEIKSISASNFSTENIQRLLEENGNG